MFGPIHVVIIDFTDGVGYIEGDCGRSFPKSYAWFQCNDFLKKACVTVSIADIPFAGFHFQGCICAVHINDTEYRLATYKGVKILACTEDCIVLKQRDLTLELQIFKSDGQRLLAPAKGRMNREIRESIVCPAKIRFSKNDNILIDEVSNRASFEFVQGH